MTASGCAYNGGVCHEIVEHCSGCGRTVEYNSGWYCSASPEPAKRWQVGNCNMATHVKSAASTAQAKVNPLKASKRAKKNK
jgi:hypothetical protein